MKKWPPILRILIRGQKINPILCYHSAMLTSNAIRSTIILIILILLLGLVFGWQYWRQQTLHDFSNSQHTAAISVEIGEARTALWYPQINSIGTVNAVQGIMLSPEIDSKIKAIYFTSGQLVKKGDLLVELDDNAAKAGVANAKAAYEIAKLTYERSKRLAKMRAISRSDLDNDLALMNEAKANLDLAQATTDQLVIKAPFDGRIGLLLVSVGQVAPKATQIASLQQVDPVNVDFDLPESILSQIHVGDEVQIKVSTYPNQIFRGKIIALNANLNIATRTLQMRASVANPEEKLIPGMFTEVNVVLPEPHKVVVVPAMAINYSTFGDSVFEVVNDKAVQKYVTVGEQRDAEVAVEGINDGDTIVTAGIFKLQNGSPVIIANRAPLKITQASKPQSLLHDKKVEKLLNPANPAAGSAQ